MKPPIILTHEFVESFPERLEEEKLYVSIEFATVAHSCACGCGHQVITPLSPSDWQLIFDGESISLHPSVGNWSFDCQSHYWIEKNKVRWSYRFSQDEIDYVRASDRRALDAQYTPASIKQDQSVQPTTNPPPNHGFFKRLLKRFGISI